MALSKFFFLWMNNEWNIIVENNFLTTLFIFEACKHTVKEK